MPTLTVVMIVVALVVGALALRYLETQLVAPKWERLALATVSAIEMQDRLLAERDGDVQMMARQSRSRTRISSQSQAISSSSKPPTPSI